MTSFQHGRAYASAPTRNQPSRRKLKLPSLACAIGVTFIVTVLAPAGVEGQNIAIEVLKVDVDAAADDVDKTGARTQKGFLSLPIVSDAQATKSGGSCNPVMARSTGDGDKYGCHGKAVSVTDGDTGIKVTLEGYTIRRAYGAERRAKEYGFDENLITDAADRAHPGSMTLTLDNVEAGEYRLTSYHDDATWWHCGGCFPITLVYYEGNVRKYISQWVRTSAYASVKKAHTNQFTFKQTKGSAPVVLDMTHDGGGSGRKCSSTTCKATDDSTAQPAQTCGRCTGTSAASAGHYSFNGFILEKLHEKTATTVTQTTTTTITTTHTKFQALFDGLNANEKLIETQVGKLSGTQDAQQDAINALKQQLKDAAMATAAVEQKLADAVKMLTAKVTTNALASEAIREAITRMVAAIPVDPAAIATGVGRAQCAGQGCAPTVETDDKGLVLRAPAGTVTFETKACGVLDPCEAGMQQSEMTRKILAALRQLELD